MATGLSIENNHNFLGNDFIADGSDRSTYSPFNDEPTVATDEQVKKAKEEKEDEDGFNWGKLIGNVVAALVVVAVVAVVAVLVVATGGAALAAVGVIAAGTASTAATVAGVGALVVGTAAVANLAASDIQRGEVSDIGTYISTGAKKACMGAVFGAMFGPVGIAVETVLSIGSISDEIDNAMLNIDNTFDAFNKEFGIDNPIIIRREGLIVGTGKFVWGFIKSTEFMGETFYDMGAFAVAAIGNELGLVSDEETDELRDKFNVDKETWKQVPEAIGNSINNVIVNAPRFFFDPNMTEKEASDFVNDALMTAAVVKGTVDVAKAIKGKVPDVINKAIEEGKKREIADEGATQAEIRERVLKNIEESKIAREASNYKKIAEFENTFKKVGEATNGVLKTTGDLLKETTCSNDKLYQYLKSNDEYLKTNYANQYVDTGKWPNDIQIPKSSDVLTSKGSIDWSQVPDSGYVLDSSGKAIKEIYFPKKGEVIDRYGPSNGTFTSPVIDGKPYSYDNRSLPYIDDLGKNHQYELTDDLSKLSDNITNCTNKDLVQDINDFMSYKKIKSYDDLISYKGEIASGFGVIGGGIQYQLPLPVDILEELGLLKIIK